MVPKSVSSVTMDIERLSEPGSEESVTEDQQHQRADGGADESARFNDHGIAPAQNCRQQAADKRAGDSQDGGADETHPLWARHNRAGQQASDKPEDDPAAKAHFSLVANLTGERKSSAQG